MSQEQNPGPSDTRHRIEGGNADRKMNREIESSSNPPGQFEAGPDPDPGPGQVLNAKENLHASIKNLPREMLLEILKCVDTCTLFACRLVNRSFNSISTGILPHRPDAQVRFEFTQDNKFVWRKGTGCEPGIQDDLQEFTRFMKTSKKNAPYAHFAFFLSCKSIATKFFDHPHFTEFLLHFYPTPSKSKSKSSQKASKDQNQNQHQNQRVKGLDLTLPDFLYFSGFEPVTRKLRDLFVNKTPFLENLSLEFQRSEYAPQIQLLPFINQNRGQISLRLEPELAAEFLLPHLKTLGFTTHDTLGYFGILQDLLKAAVNLKSLYLHQKDRYQEVPLAMEHFERLQSLGKFHLVKNFYFLLNTELFSTLTARPDFTRALFNLELEELKVGIIPAYRKPNNPDHTRATNLISALFESQKDRLKRLEMEGLGSLTTLQFPTLTTLTRLQLQETCGSNAMFFPPGVRSLDIFPAVSHLDLSKNWCYRFPHFESIPVLPSVKNLNVSVVSSEFTSNCISLLDSLCPNLTNLRIHKDKDKEKDEYSQSAPQLNFLLVAPQIWTLMTQLESLEIDIKVDSADENLSNSAQLELDSCFTGISVENCKRLYQIRESTKSQAKETTRKNPLGFGEHLKPEETKTESESQLTAQREHASILDMKSLKKLRINAYRQDSGRWSKMDSKEFYTKKLTWISHDYAFKLLPNLKLC